MLIIHHGRWRWKLVIFKWNLLPHLTKNSIVIISWEVLPWPMAKITITYSQKPDTSFSLHSKINLQPLKPNNKHHQHISAKVAHSSPKHQNSLQATAAEHHLHTLNGVSCTTHRCSHCPPACTGLLFRDKLIMVILERKTCSSVLLEGGSLKHQKCEIVIFVHFAFCN